jgi:TolA-binding protein
VLASWKPVHARLLPLRTRTDAFGNRLATSRAGSAVTALFGWYDRHRSWLAPSVLFLAGLAVLLFAFALRQTDASVLYNQGLEQFFTQRYAQAVPLFETAMKQNPNSPSAINANYYYAICFFKQNQWEKTIDIFTQMIVKYPDSIYIPEAEYHIGLSLQNLGRKDQAIAKFRVIMARYPASPWAGHARTQLDAGSAPAPVVGSVTLSSPAGPRAEFDAALALYDQNRLQEAGQAFRAIVDNSPNDELAADSYMYYCFTLFRREMYLQTIQELRIMLNRFPGSPWIPEVQYHIGLSLMRLGQTLQAAAEFEWILKNAPESRWVGFAKERLGEIKK